jgi:uracil-DNA glycosylase family 4
LADKWERYLRQQIELGGSEVILSRADGRTGGRADPSSTSTQAVAEDTVRLSDSPSVQPSARPPVRPSTWRKGAPPIPGPGIAVESPGHVLGDELIALETIEAVAQRIRTTHCCALCPNRINAVPGEGNPNAELFLVGEGPGATEDAQGLPFVGQAGTLLNGILEAIEVPRDSVYITNIVKCRPPQNRKPLPDEIAACIPYLHRQLEIIKPKVILALGSTAAEAMLGVRKSLGELRNKVHTYNGIPLIVTYHPAALLRNPNWKKPTWDDVRIARQLLER